MFQKKYNMTSKNAKQILSDLYGLMMEINFHRAEEDVLKELQDDPDHEIDKYLIKVKQLKTKLDAKRNENRFQKAMKFIKSLHMTGLDEIEKSLAFEDRQKLLPLFRKFENLSEEDENEILEDNELLYYLEALKDKLDEDDQP